MTYANEEISFIKENYPKYGPKYCGLKLNRNAEAVGAFAKRLGIKKIGFDKHPSMQKINPEQFWDITTPEVAYFLGYFWADGHINYKINKTSNCYIVAMEIVSEDMQDIWPIFNKLGQWHTSQRQRQHWKPISMMGTNSKDIYEFLYQNGYKSKSNEGPDKILAKIPDHLKVYWWRGYFDGDGSLSFGVRAGDRWKCLQFSSTYNYDWNYIIEYLKNLGISNPITRQEISKRGHKCSKLSLGRKEDINIFIEYLLQSNIGLSRKTNKMNEFLVNYRTKPTVNPANS